MDSFGLFCRTSLSCGGWIGLLSLHKYTTDTHIYTWKKPTPAYFVPRKVDAFGLVVVLLHMHTCGCVHTCCDLLRPTQSGFIWVTHLGLLRPTQSGFIWAKMKLNKCAFASHMRRPHTDRFLPPPETCWCSRCVGKNSIHLKRLGVFSKKEIAKTLIFRANIAS